MKFLENWNDDEKFINFDNFMQKIDHFDQV